MRSLFTLMFCVLFATNALAQGTGTIRGFLYEDETGEPLIYALVKLKTEGVEKARLAQTNEDGLFVFANVPVGEHTIVASYSELATQNVPVIVEKGKILVEKIFLIKSDNPVELGDVKISAKRQEARREVKVSSVKVTPKQISSLPSTGGEPDLVQYLQVIPGVVFTGDQGGQLYIRGGSPVQNKMLLDGMTIYNPFHSIGFFSVFETEAIKSVDVLTGGFDAGYGGRISAIVDIKTRDGNKKRHSGLVSASPFQAKVLAEGPLKALDANGTGTSISYLLTAKHSYIQQTSKSLYGYATDDNGLPYGYTDVYGKLSFNMGGGSKVNLFGFNFTDKVDYQGLADLNWDSYGGGTNFNLLLTGSQMLINGYMAYSQYKISLDEGDNQPRESTIGGFNLGLNFSIFGKDSEVNYGLEVNGFRTSFEFTNPLGFRIDQFENTTELAGYVKYKHNIKERLIIEPSIRAQYYASLGDASIEPRLGMKVNITDKIRFKFAGGFFSQNLISSVNEEDVVNLFVAYLSGPEETVYDPSSNPECISGDPSETTGCVETDHKLQKSIHGIAGMEFDITNNLTFNVEPYYKRFTQVLGLNRNKLDINAPNFTAETGNAYGIDFWAEYKTKNLFVWAVYSLGYVNRNDGQQEYPTIFDRRHNVNLVTTYQFGKSKLWEAGVRWNLGSGFPFTQTQGFYDQNTFGGGIGTNVNQENGDLGVIYADERNGGRLPYYHRLDLSLKRTFVFTKNTKLELTASITNTYNRKNIFYFDRIEYERVDQLPILPSLAMKFMF